MSSSVAIAIVALALGTTGPAPASAQNTEPSPTALLADYTGNKLRVTDAAGTRFKGTLIAVRNDEIDVLTKAGTRTVNFDNITRVERRGDSVKDGLGKGVLIGAAWCMATGASPVGIALCAFNGGWIGALIDALHRGWTPVYVREETRPEWRR